MSPSVRLQRGANTVVSTGPTAGKVVASFGWSLVESRGPATEVVTAAILLGPDDRAVSPDALVFFNQLASPDGEVRYVPDGEQDAIEVDLPSVPSGVEKIALVVYVNPDLRQPGSFAAVRGPYVRLLDRAGNEILRYDILAADTREASAVIFGELYRHRDQWKFRAVGQGYKDGVLGVARDFGLPL